MTLINSEFRKLFTTRTWIWLLIGCVALALLQTTTVLGFAGSGDTGSGAPGMPTLDSPEILAIVLSSPSTATIFIGVLGILGMTTEYRHRTITTTFLATPHRWRVVLAKFITYLALGIAYAATAALFVCIVAMIWINAGGGSFTLGNGNYRILIGSALASALYGIIGVAVGALARNQIAAIVGLLAYSFVVERILSVIPATQSMYKFLPGGSSTAMYTFDTVRTQATDLLSPLGGGIVLTLYAVILGLLAYVVSTRREVS